MKIIKHLVLYSLLHKIGPQFSIEVMDDNLSYRKLHHEWESMKDCRGQVRMLKTAPFLMDGNWEAKFGMLLMNVVHAPLQIVCALTKRKLC